MEPEQELALVAEKIAADAENAVAFSRLLDYAWLRDRDLMERGQLPKFFDELLAKQYDSLMRGFNGTG